MGRRYKNIVNEKYGRLTVLSLSDKKTKYRATYWLCKCDCGIEKIVSLSGLTNGTQSCGCFRRERTSERVSKGYQVAAKNKILRRYKSDAKKRNYIWEISDDFFYSLVFSNCHYCGSPPLCSTEALMQASSHIKYNGIDRKDNNIGYVESNCLSCCRFCNFSKLCSSYEEFVAWMDRLIEFRSKI